MHTEQQLRDIGILNKGLQLINIELALKPGAKLQHAVLCRYINNEDGSLRWLWAAESRRPVATAAFSEISGHGRSALVQAGLRSHLPGASHTGKLTLYTNSLGARQLQQLSDWAIFTGDKGLNRKLSIWHKDLEGRTAITKLSLTTYAAKNIYTERMALQQLLPEGIVKPDNVATSCLAFTQQDIFADSAAQPITDIGELHLDTLQRWLSHNLRTQKLNEASWYQDALDLLHNTKPCKDDRISRVLLQKMRMLIDCMLPSAMVPVGRAHGGFTPQNVRRRGSELLLANWGECREDMPALYDLFHFIYQNNILVRKQPFAVIRREIDELFKAPEWESFLLHNDIDPGEAEQQYLLSIIGHYLQEYARQPYIDREALTLMQTWCEALGFWMDYEGLLTQREIVLQDIAHFLHDKPYAALKLCAADITALPITADLELCMPDATAKSLVSYLGLHRCVDRIRQRTRTCRRHISVFLSSGASLHLECISELRSGALIYADAQLLWSRAKVNEAGVKQPALSEDMQYARLQYLLERKPMPQYYSDYYLSQSISRQFDLLDELPEAGTKSFADLLQYDDDSRQQKIAFLKNEPVNRGWRGLRNRIQCKMDKLRDLIPQRGFVITFSGVDGAGKRTVIEATRHRISQELRMPVVVLPHRPSLFASTAGQSEGCVSISLVPEQLPQPASRSPFKALSVAIDYAVSQCYIHFRYVMRGYVVLYDHYFDFVKDNKDSRIVLPSAYTNWWYRFVLKPDLNILLYAPAEVILQRRQELSAEDITRLTKEYLELFRKLERRSGHGHYISVRNLRLGNTVEQLFQHIKTQAEAAA